jgi:hypothetical protein
MSLTKPDRGPPRQTGPRLTVDHQTTLITEPGIYSIPADEYHAHPALSSSGARRLLPPSCPALFKWERDNGQGHKRVFDFGHAAHKMVLGDGPELVVVDAADWRTKAAKEERDAAYAEGNVPLLPAEFETVQLMAAEQRRHPAAFEPTSGKPEQSLFACDPATGVWLRARLDWLPDPSDGRMRIVDYKTTVSAEPAAFARSVAKFGYYMQAAWYLDIVHALGIADDPAFVFIAQEKTPPYLVCVFELDEYALRIGRKRNREAIEVFADCTARGEWPGYATEVATISLPAWFDDVEEMSL